MHTGGWTPARLKAAAVLAVGIGLTLIVAAAQAGPLVATLVGAGLFLGSRAAPPRFRRALAEDRQRQREVLRRADQQNAWASRGDPRGVYGTAGAELMRTLSPAQPLTPPGDQIAVAGVVHSDAELTALLKDRLPCWRYAAFVSVLVQRRAAVLARVRDARTGFASGGGESIRTEFEAGLYFTQRLQEMSDLIDQIDGFMLSAAFQEVFGDPHDEDSANPGGIVHAANRLMDYHERLLVLSERCREVRVPHGCRDLQRDVGRLTVLPLEGFETFIETFIDRVREMADVARYATGDVQLDPVELGVNDENDLLVHVFQRLRDISRHG